MRWFSAHQVLQMGILMLLAVVPHQVEATGTSWQAAQSETTKFLQINLPACCSDDESHPHPPQASVDFVGDILDKEEDREPPNERTESATPYYALFNRTTLSTNDSLKPTSAVTESVPIADNPIFLLTRRIRQ